MQERARQVGFDFPSASKDAHSREMRIKSATIEKSTRLSLTNNDPAVRQTIHLDDELYRHAVDRAKQLCFPAFSDYIQALMRADVGLTLENPPDGVSDERSKSERAGIR